MESKYDYVVFDIETTGLHPDSDQICEIAAIGVKDGLPQGTFSTLVAIEGSMPEAAGRVNGIIRHRSSGTWVTFKTPQERFCGVVFSHGAANRGGGKARREGKGVTVTRRAMLQRWRLVRMGDGWGRQG